MLRYKNSEDLALKVRLHAHEDYGITPHASWTPNSQALRKS